MTIGIAHFTDIHFTVQTNLDNKLKSCIDALRNDFYGVSKIYFVLSGDIAFSGKKVEYELAKAFFGRLKMLLEMHHTGVLVHFVIVPGNHDCNIDEYDSQIRINQLNNLNYKSLGSDNSVTDICLKVQDDFWDYYKLYNPIPVNKLFYQVCDKVDDFNICFHCINTAWMSEKYEKPGNIFFPVKRFDSFNNEECYLNVGVWHHPYNWFTPNTAENNKKEYQHFTERIAAIHLLGHEHENEHYLNENISTGEKVNLISGKVFNLDNSPKDSGFETIIVDLPTRMGQLKLFEWESDLYNSKVQRTISFIKEVSHQFENSVNFINELNEIKIPLVIGNRKQIQLSEIYVFPNMESMTSDINSLDNYPDTVKLLENKYGSCVIAGEEQIGKTSLLNILYLKKRDQGCSPLLITGKEIKELDLNKILKKAFKKQYENTDDAFERYLQLDTSKKILLIDDYQDCTYNAVTAYKLLKEAMAKFDTVIITIDAAHSMLPSLQTEFKDIGFYRINQLGYLKRNELIERYHYLKENPYNFDEQNFLSNTKESFDNVGAILGDKLIPSYPVFVLSILQSLEYKSLKQNETSFGYCYQSLLHFSLHKAGVKNDDIDTYLNFLTELAYHFIISDKEVISDIELLTFYSEYKKRYLSPAYEIIITNLKNSKILHFPNDEVAFGYNYILYYLSAKKISDIIHKDEGKKVVQKLFKDLHVEKNANILVFITHHCKDITFIEESLLNSMIVLDRLKPITLALNDSFYNEIKAIASEVTKDILEINRNPKDEREKQLKKLDESITKNEVESSDANSFEQMDKITLPFKQSFRSIEIVGQILKNRKGSLEISQLKSMIKELYTTAFRTISYVSEILNAGKNEYILFLNDDEALASSRAEIEQRINKFIQVASFQACLGVFSKLMNAMGNRELRMLYNEVAAELDTPAAKLVSFSINSYYGAITEKELKTITNDLKNNPVAQKILRARIKAYVYSRNLDLPTKQKFASILGMHLGPKKPGNAAKNPR